MSQKNVLITGTSSGFGRLAAEALARAGHQVYATMRGVDGKNTEAAQALQSLATTEGLALTLLELDVTREEDINAVAAKVAEQSGHLDVLVNNAGIFGMGPTEAYSAEQFRSMMETNVIGVHALTAALLPVIRKAESGLVVNISSGVGRLTMPGAGIYSATKFALEALTEAYRYDSAEHGVDFVAIEPGVYGTDIFGKNMTPANEALLANYPQFMQTLEKLGEALGESMSSEEANDPKEIGEKVIELMALPHGQRPLRVPVGKDVTDMVNGLNKDSANYQRDFLNAFGFGQYAPLAE